jgi:hypothetical protein
MNNAITVFQSACSDQDHENITQITQHLFRLMKTHNENKFLSNIINARHENVLSDENWKYNAIYDDVHIVNEIKKVGKKTTIFKKLSPMFIDRLEGSGDSCIILLKHINCFVMVNLIKKAIKKINKQEGDQRNQIYKDIISFIAKDEGAKQKMRFLLKYLSEIVESNSSSSDILNYNMIDVLFGLSDEEYGFVFNIFYVYTI